MEFAGGRLATLRHLTQWPTYRGLIEGSPTSTTNSMVRDEAYKIALESLKLSQGLVFLPADVRKGKREQFQGRPPEWLPEITCVAEFLSFQPTRREPECDFSTLSVVWFQKAWAMAIAEEILEHLRQTDWDHWGAVVKWGWQPSHPPAMQS